MILWIDTTDSLNSIPTLKCTLGLKDNFNKIIKNLQNAEKPWRIENILIYSLESKNVENLQKFDKKMEIP